MELLFNHERSHRVAIPDSYTQDQLKAFPNSSSDEDSEKSGAKQPTDIRYLIHWIRHFLLGQGQNPDLFMQGDTVYVLYCFPIKISVLTQKLPISSRPGILVLINSVDWELEGEEAYELQPNDEILFISTLHGG